MRNHVRNFANSASLRSTCLVFVSVIFLLALAVPANAQKDKKNKKNAPPADTSSPSNPMSNEQQIEYLISDMLGAWQIGDVDKMHKDYAEDVSVVNGSWAPPVMGWPSYLAAYQQQRARLKQVRLDRTNTFIKVEGTMAWACYQWDFAGTVDGNPSAAQGQTTLILEKRPDHWVIVHNHTSLVQASQPAVPSGQSTVTPAAAAHP